MASGTIAVMLWINMDKDYDHQMWAEETPRNSNSFETVNIRDLDSLNNQTSRGTPSRVFLENVWGQLQMVTSAAKIYWEAFFI